MKFDYLLLEEVHYILDHLVQDKLDVKQRLFPEDESYVLSHLVIVLNDALKKDCSINK